MKLDLGALRGSVRPFALLLTTTMAAACAPGGRGGIGARDAGWASDGAATRDGGQVDDAAAKPFGGEYSDPSAPPGAKDAFGGPVSVNAAAAPRIVYPLDGAMLGRNIGGMNIQWSAGTGNTIFRVRVHGEKGDAAFYAGDGSCPAGKCQLQVPDGVWLGVGGANAGARITLTIDAVASAGSAVASSAGVKLDFAPEDIAGGMYYWSTTLEGIMRAKLGESKATPFLTMPNAPKGRCIGCHALSRDGCKLAITYRQPASLGVVSASDATKIALGPDVEQSNFKSWNPEGTRLISVFHSSLTERDEFGALIATVPPSFIGPPGRSLPTQPDWSPDGASIALTNMATPNVGDGDQHGGDIMILPYAGGAFGPATVLVPQGMGGRYHYYPGFSPDSQWVAFNTGDVPYVVSQPSSRLRMVPAAGGAPIELANATQGTGVTASWPRFSPFAQRSNTLFFIVFSSKIDYGWVIEQSGSLKRRSQLWVAAIDVTRPSDPSFAPFWLPIQDPAADNHLGFWTEKIAGGGTAGGKPDCGPICGGPGQPPCWDPANPGTPRCFGAGSCVPDAPCSGGFCTVNGVMCQCTGGKWVCTC